MKIIKLTDKELLDLERIIMDDDKTEAINFIKLIREKIEGEERLKMKILQNKEGDSNV